MNVLGVKITGHDTGAALIADERITAIAEERLNRVKHSRDIFPRLSIEYCLNHLGVAPEDVDLIVIDQIELRAKLNMKDLFLNNTKQKFSKARIEIINHHDAHAASAFFCSPFNESAILIYDGAGEKFATHLGVSATETDTLYYGRGSKIFQLQKTLHLRRGKIFPYTYGVGKLYGFISRGYLGFGRYQEGKMMGLAPYGNDSILKQIPLERWLCERDTHVICNARIDYKPTGVFGKWKQKLSLVLEALRKKLGIWFFNSGYQDPSFFIEPNIFEEILLPRPPRKKDDPLPDEYYSSVAYAVQKVFEEVAVRWGRRLKEITNSRNLCVAGGSALNIDANKKFLDVVGFENLFIQPGASDTGVALGNAFYGWHMILGKPRFWQMKSAQMGRRYSEKEILKVIGDVRDKTEVRKSKDVAKETARLLADKKIIGWFYGGAEYGPRALGHRSILCDPRPIDMKDILNNNVKHREPWRPFAASVLKEGVSEWFEYNGASPFMLLAVPVRKDKQKKIPSVTHIDGTCRIQTVTRQDNGRYYDLISEFFKLTGVPMVLNTSFNLAGEPIVETPADALKCFLSTKMDYLVLEDYLVSKKEIEKI